MTRMMREIWRRTFTSISHGVDVRIVLLRSTVLALLSILFTSVYFHYLLFRIPHEIRISVSTGPWCLLATQLFLLFIICLLSCMVGMIFSTRLDLPGFGVEKDFIRFIPLLLLIALVMTAISYPIFDRRFYALSPASYPNDFMFLLFLPLKGAFTEEIILRFGLVTIAVGLLKNRFAGIILVSVLASIFSIKYYHFMGVDTGMNDLMINHIVLSFTANLILGYLFISRGLLYSMALKFLFYLKYMVYVGFVW